MAHAGQELQGQGGYSLRLVQTAAETGSELLEMEATWAAGGNLPPAHLHPSQAESFEVLDGAVQTIIEGVERRYETGETFEIPAGTMHQMTGDGPARVNWQVRPALRTAEFFERLLGDPPQDAREAEEFFEEFSAEIRFSAP